MKSLKIIFRSCAVVKSLNPQITRPFGLDKETIILKCLKSLLESCAVTKNRISIDIIDDSSEDKFVKKIRCLLSDYSFKYKIHRLKFKNNGKSLEYCFRLAEKVKEDIIYFCEDDYIHLKEAISYILDAYNSKIIGTSEFGVHPTDYPKYYIDIFPAYIFISQYCHWRSIICTTGTFFITKKLFQKFKHYLYALADFNKKDLGGEEKTINKIWKEVPCIAPIESLAAHLDNNASLPPFVNWKKVLK